jgi:hypothetical protein
MSSEFVPRKAEKKRIKLNVAYPETRRMPLDHAIAHVRGCRANETAFDALNSRQHDDEDCARYEKIYWNGVFGI